MRQLYNAGFREIYHKIIYIRLKDEDLKAIGEAVEMMDGADGVIAYGFLEEHAPMSFMVLASARYKDEVPDDSDLTVTVGPAVHEEYCRFRFGDAEECGFLTQDMLGIDPEEYAGFRERIDTLFEPQDSVRRAFLELDLVDRSRNLEFPEYVSVTLYKEGFAPELAWARCSRIEEGGAFRGHVAHTPRQDFGIDPENEILIRAYDNGKGGIMLMWDAGLN